MKHRLRRRGKPGQTAGTTAAQGEPARAPLDVGLASTANAGAKRSDPFITTAPLGAAPELPAEETSEIPPSLYSRFEAFKLLGQGGMGVVYGARDIRLGRQVAIKLLFGADPEHGGSLLREARSQARVTHENVCEVFEAGTADHVRFIVMQLIDGEPLDKAKASMTLEQKVRVIRQVASALHEAHRLGTVHRDVKPANIMVEQGEDGAWKPYIMDFGLAREMGDSGSTVSGALMGTPSFMSPEQAAGKVRSLDRRTDVYGLGATLYDVIVGRPPLIAEGLAPLLQAIVNEEPIAARQIERDVPLDLDAIVMKCLEKQPAARYDSAKALGDDLQRFLDGEPVFAMKRARLYALFRRAKRHKVKLSIASVALVVTTVFVGGWMSERVRAEKQAILSRELGENVKEMEFFLRNAHGMPLHDIDRERNIVRGRLKTIESAIRAAGEIGVGPGHYALGRGHLALQEPGEALAHLKQAAAAGYRAAGLDYAMGMSLSEIYRKELADTKRMEGEQKKQRIAAIEAEYKEPALSHLRAALGGTIEASAYVEGLIAFYEGRTEDALAKAREAFEKAPWLYEAKKLEGDVLFVMGSKFGHDAAFDFETMSKWFGEADAAYRVAAEIGSSDPVVHVAMCELYTQRMNGEHAARKAIRPSFEDAKGACKKASDASPSSGLGYLRLAQAYAHFAWHVGVGDASNEDPETALTEAVEKAEEAARRSPEDPMARYVVGSVWRTRAVDASDRGLDVVPAVDHAITAYGEALRLDPAFVWALNESCSAHSIRARREIMHGIDPSGSIKDGLSLCKKAIEIEPTFTYAKANEILHHLTIVEHRVQSGKAPGDAAQEAARLIDLYEKQAPGSWPARYCPAMLGRAEATYLLDLGADPAPALTRVDASARELAHIAPTSSSTSEVRGDAAAIRARALWERGDDPSPWVDEAREAYASALKARPWDLIYRASAAEVEVIALGWASSKRDVSEARFDAALAPLLSMLDVERADPRLYHVVAELHALRATLRITQKRDAEHEIDEGLSRITKALSIHPRMAKALACKGRLLLLRATTAKDPQTRGEAAKRAVEAFSAAVRENPLLERLERRGIEQATRFVEGAPSRAD